MIGFVGLGVMGEPMARNLHYKSSQDVIVFDLSAEPLERLRSDGAQIAESLQEVAETADIIFLSLPSGAHVDRVIRGAAGLLVHLRSNQIIVDLGTSPVTMVRDLAALLGAMGVSFADAPVARTREAAITGTLSIMVGADYGVYATIEPLLRCIASDITHCGDVGAGQVVKILNNMVLFQTVNALAEALTVGRRAGVDADILFNTLSKGSADSFALRNHGMKSMLPGVFPERAFSTDYARKDLSYALDLAREQGVTLRGAETTDGVLSASSAAGYANEYFPALVKVVDAASLGVA